MYIIKFVNEDNNISYNGESVLEDRINYVMGFDKVSRDKLRVNNSDVICSGLSSCPFAELMKNDPEAVFLLMRTNTFCWGKDFNNVIKHRVISFPSESMVLPADLNLLGKNIAEFYSSRGFIACYGVHRDTYNYHIHILINTTAYTNGYKMNIYHEYNYIHNIVRKWEKNYMNIKLSDPKTLEKYSNKLFGDDCVPAYKTGLGGREQIKSYREYNEVHKNSR